MPQAIHISPIDNVVVALHPIASDRSGYFYATNAGEVYDTIRQLKQMASGLEAAISGLERSMERFRERGEAGHG